jgi:hypothetical protein
LNCQITAASFKNPSANATSNDITIASNGKPNSTQFAFTVTSNTACTSMSVSLPKSGGTYVVILASYSDAGGVRTWTATDSFGNSDKFVKANNQSGTVTGSSSATFTITFNVHT